MQYLIIGLFIFWIILFIVGIYVFPQYQMECAWACIASLGIVMIGFFYGLIRANLKK